MYCNSKKRGGAQFDARVHEKLLYKWSKYYIGPEKTLIMRIGTMGSGKTSAVNLFIEEELGYNQAIFSIIDLDKIVTTSEYMTDPDKWWDAQVTIGGYEITDKIIRESIKAKKNFSTESTGKFICPNRKLITIASKAGYNLIGICPYVPYYELKSRIKKRADEEGRAVTTSELEDNLKNMLPKLFEIVPLCDKFFVINNLVKKGDSPEKLLSVETDFTKYDSTKCCDWEFNDDATNRLLSKLDDNIDKYKTHSELDIFELEKKFLTKLLSTTSHGY